MAEGLPQRRMHYGRSHGKALRAGQRRLMTELLPRLKVPGVLPPGAPERQPVDPVALFGDRPVWLEIGFGGGEHLAHLAAHNPDIGFIGCEPFVNGQAMLLGRIAEAEPANLRLHPGDARDLLDLLPGASLARVYLLYPDPWPKTRHRARRFMNPENLRALARVMRPGAELRLATDIPDYVTHSLAALAEAGGFAELDRPGGRMAPWDGWLRTRYEAKALREGRNPQYLVFRRTDPA